MLVILWPMVYAKENKIYAIYFHVKKIYTYFVQIKERRRNKEVSLP